MQVRLLLYMGWSIDRFTGRRGLCIMCTNWLTGANDLRVAGGALLIVTLGVLLRGIQPANYV